MFNEIYFTHAGQKYVWCRRTGMGVIKAIVAPGLHVELLPAATPPELVEAAVVAYGKLLPAIHDPDRRPVED